MLRLVLGALFTLVMVVSIVCAGIIGGPTFALLGAGVYLAYGGYLLWLVGLDGFWGSLFTLFLWPVGLMGLLNF